MYTLKKVLFTLTLTAWCFVEDGSCTCTLSLAKDFGQPSPVYIKDGGLLSPSTRGNVVVERGERLSVACPGDKRAVVLGNDTTDVSLIEAVCVSNSTFRAGRPRWRGRFSELRCSGAPWYSAEYIGTTSHGHCLLYKVGYKVGGQFLATYEVCFSRGRAHSLYAAHALRPAAKFAQVGQRRPQFIEGDLFDSVRMSALYSNKHQRERLNAVLGEGADLLYMSKNEFLTRGHLAPRADFPMHAEQRASFHYANTAPQWMRNNAGDWAALEEALRRRTHALNASVTVYTGTLGVLTLPDTKGVSRELYLATDENNNGIVPVPLYFYKLVYFKRRKTATAFVTINSSWYNATTADGLTFCEDVCDGDSRFSWLRWRADGAKSFCCTYSAFIKKVPYLPKMDVSGGLFH